MLLALHLSLFPLAVVATPQGAIIVAIPVTARLPGSLEIRLLRMPEFAIVLGSTETSIEGIAARLRRVRDSFRARIETSVIRRPETSKLRLPERFPVRLLQRLPLHSEMVHRRRRFHSHGAPSGVEEVAPIGMREIVAATPLVMVIDLPFELEADPHVLFADRMISTRPASTGRMIGGQMQETTTQHSHATSAIDRYEICHQSRPLTPDPAVAQRSHLRPHIIHLQRQDQATVHVELPLTRTVA